MQQKLRYTDKHPLRRDLESFNWLFTAVAAGKAGICNTEESYPAPEFALISKWPETILLGMTDSGTALKSYRETKQLS